MARNEIQFRLAGYARWLLIVTTKLAKHTGIRVPHHWVVAVTNRSWRMRTNDGPWVPIRINNAGRIVQ